MSNRNWCLLGAAIFTVSASIAPFFSTVEYDWVSQATGELAGRQNMNSWIMRVGLVGLGFCFFVDALQDRSRFRRDWPFALFGLAIIGAGLYRRTSVDAGVFLDEPLANGHGWFFVVSSLFLALGFVLRVFAGEGAKQRLISLAALAILLGCAYAAFTLPAYVGVFDRLAYLGVFTWVILNPRRSYGTYLDRVAVRPA